MSDSDADSDADGTQQSGYVPPELGPFQCQNCTKYQADGTTPKNCAEPKVQDDPEVDQVDAEGCCNFFKSKQQGEGDEGEAAQNDDESGEADAIAGGPTERGGYT